jgi:hypothetical protein
VKTPAHSTAIHRIEPEAVPSPTVLEAWSGHTWTDGVQVDRLRDLEALRVRTRNTQYEITIISAETGEAVIIGGRFFPQRTRAVVLGSSLGGAFLKMRGIYRGFSLELYATGTRIVTSAVQSVEVVGDRHLGRVQ